ncbi:MAG: 50S ribosomal protein L9 [Candidatus Delongbacteria bacterium]|jgi:large subunit ribosomal protein L9|nr:50S ribosomal protein L9 [Candidatus Delongbacteria bacterium]MDD4205746.1 50S ribosomal protein L9 [Candidatus Delongbacteria bacterium]MDY0018309.1 50S ribosomal protein L9 [Candidatus Delongbacteria bacterium]
MLIILRQDIEKVGKAGEVIKVKDGFARNYLIPNQLAFPATDSYMNRYKETTKSKGYKVAQLKKSEEFLKKMLEEKTVVIKMKVGEENKLFGSVTSQNIADELKSAGIDIDRKRIHLEENIKLLGEYKIPYKSHSDLDIQISVNVVPEAE